MPKKDRRKVGTDWAGGGIEAGRVISQGRRHKALCGDILQGRQRKGLYGPTKARMRFRGIKFVRLIRKPWEGKRPAGGRRVIKGMNILMKNVPV
ncbi:hypothetical protein BY996DRAFT_6473320 [Phakopsora pachyrhizi]|nr:hypothetical protein BY996DRAFT_6473320 [Phakopsora pachyrhizi]